jgi:hypothetical protein
MKKVKIGVCVVAFMAFTACAYAQMGLFARFTQPVSPCEPCTVTACEPVTIQEVPVEPCAPAVTCDDCFGVCETPTFGFFARLRGDAQKVTVKRTVTFERSVERIPLIERPVFKNKFFNGNACVPAVPVLPCEPVVEVPIAPCVPATITPCAPNVICVR